MPFKSSNKQWLGKISLQILVWLDNQPCLRGAVYCLILKECTCALLLVVLWKKMHSDHAPLLTEMKARRSIVKGYIVANTFA